MEQRRSRVIYVETQAGWRAFFLALLIAAVLGLGFRLYFSPPRLKAWVTSAIEQQKRHMAHPFALSFTDASLRLSQGYLPQLAVVVTGVHVAPNPECHPEASVFIGELRLPFRVLPLLAGRAAVGVISARDIEVDLDGLRARCDEIASQPKIETRGPHESADLVETAIKLTGPKADEGSAKPWWTDEQYETVRSFVEGLEFSHATLQFEKKTKEIYLDSFSVLFKRGGLLALETEIRIPPPVTYGEQIPPLKIEGEAISTKASLLVSARVSEGSLATTAILTPMSGQKLAMEARLSVKSLPLSMLTPLLRKAGLADDHFEPKFLWLDCAASITGPFQGLFQESPLRLEACHIEGDGTDIQLANAERTPQGTWRPFDVQVVSLDLAKLFATIGAHGPEGVASDFGKLDGQIHVESPQEARFKGFLRNANVSFSNRKIRAQQKIERAVVELSILKDRAHAEFKELSLTNGELSGGIQFDLDRTLRKGTAHAEIAKLRFDPSVQAVLVGGTLGDIEGEAKAKIENSRLTDFESKLKIGETQAQDFSFPHATVDGVRKGEGPPQLVIEAPEFDLKKSSAIFKSIDQIFFSHLFSDEALRLIDAHGEIVILGNGDIDWTKTRVSLEHGQIQLVSEGSMNRDHAIDGWLQVDYPKIKKLKWAVKGQMAAPVLQGNGDELTHLKARAEIDDGVLGLRGR